jgi:hypothetical protein
LRQNTKSRSISQRISEVTFPTSKDFAFKNKNTTLRRCYL